MNEQEIKDIENIINGLFQSQQINIVNRLSRKYRDQALDSIEDVVQEAFEEAWINWPVKGVPTHPSAWLQTVANNKLLNRIKCQNKL